MGNASPRMLRCTLNTVPATNDMLNNSGMQFALSLQPMALPDADDDQVQVGTNNLICDIVGASLHSKYAMIFFSEVHGFCCAVVCCTTVQQPALLADSLMQYVYARAAEHCAVIHANDLSQINGSSSGKPCCDVPCCCF